MDRQELLCNILEARKLWKEGVVDDAEPYKTKYAAADLLLATKQQAGALLAGAANAAAEGSLAVAECIACCTLERGIVLLETDLTSEGQQEIEKALQYPWQDTADAWALQQQAHNALAALWCDRGDITVSLQHLDAATELHAKIATSLQQTTSDKDHGPPAVADSGECCWAAVLKYAADAEAQYATTLYYLAQVHGHAGNKESSAAYCAATLNKQLQQEQWPHQEGSESAVNRLRPALQLLDEDVAANVHLGIAKLHLYRLVASHQRYIEGKTLQYSYSQAADAPDCIRFDALPSLPELSSLRWGDAALAADAISALALFKSSLPCFREALQYYKLDGWVTEHCNILFEMSNLYRCLAGFEADAHKRCVMHRQRSKLLQPLEGELSPQHYSGLSRSISLELGNIFREIADVKAACGRAPSKVASALATAARHYQLFLDSFRGTDGQLPDKVEPDMEQHYLSGAFNLARILQGMPQGAGADCWAGRQRSVTLLDMIVKYVTENNVSSWQEEAQLAMELSQLLAGSCDPYLCLDVGKTRRLRSAIITSTTNPKWDERAAVYLADEADTLKIEIKDADVVGAQYLGEVTIPVERILGGEVLDEWLPLTDATGKPMGNLDKSRQVVQAKVHVRIQFTSMEEEDAKRSGCEQYEVPRTYFPLRDGNRVTLYHDSVCQPGPVDGVKLADGQLFQENSCWDDVIDAIDEAERCGCTPAAATTLREPDRLETSPTLGDLLIAKAKMGVNVLLLVWDDTTNNLGLHAGLMGTHDQETLNFFKDTGVTCVLCPRQGGDEDTMLQKVSSGNMFTHHQKTIILDQPNTSQSAGHPGGHQATLQSLGSPRAGKARMRRGFSRREKDSRRVVAFIGGLDLTNGRYDRPDHPLFETLKTGGVHAEDFYNICIEGCDATKASVRQPWHDIHARVEGPVAMDICLNFMERWAKQAGHQNLTKLRHLEDHKDIHLPAEYRKFTSKQELSRGNIELRLDAIRAVDKEVYVPNMTPAETWSVQLFRTIDADSVEGFPKHNEGAFEAGLTVGKGKSIDVSIHRAYIEHIRNAQRYLYLENQYFLGSAHLWETDTDTPCYNLVPAEIALRIVSKIKAGEPFRVYIVTPMHPEGAPNSGSVQAILHFETLTRRMMYKRIAEAIAEVGLTGQVHPTDYLQFFCLGKREAAEPVSAQHVDVGLQGCHVMVLTAHNCQSFCHDVSGRMALQHQVACRQLRDRQQQSRQAASGQSTIQGKVVASRRMMIYVHSKLMIVDDAYIIVGSANINQRSLDGSRDTEIAIGAFQDGYVLRSTRDQLPLGQVAGFRKTLWKEHLGDISPVYDDPTSLECMRAMQNLAKANWQVYCGPEARPLPHGFLMPYPNLVGDDGSVTPLPDCEEFPDLGGKILGTKSTVLPGLLTT
eukprot:gene6308-6543_t